MVKLQLGWSMSNEHQTSVYRWAGVVGVTLEHLGTGENGVAVDGLITGQT
jgi:hypothetical protein